jgi:hypothetical protein
MIFPLKNAAFKSDIPSPCLIPGGYPAHRCYGSHQENRIPLGVPLDTNSKQVSFVTKIVMFSCLVDLRSPDNFHVFFSMGFSSRPGSAPSSAIWRRKPRSQGSAPQWFFRAIWGSRIAIYSNMKHTSDLFVVYIYDIYIYYYSSIGSNWIYVLGWP